MIGRFNTIDAYAEKYSSMTPYQYGALNPISNIDMNGDSVWTTHATRTDKNGNTYIANTTHITGKVIDVTEQGGADAVASGLNSMLNNSSSSNVTTNADGTTTTVSYTIDAQFSVAHSVDDIGKTDNVVAIVDKVTGASADKQSPAAGVTSFPYGRLAYIENQGRSATNIEAAYHEVGHQLGFIDHFEGNKTDPMDYNGGLYQGNKFTGSEMKAIYDNNTTYPNINHGFNRAIITNRQNNGVTNSTSTNARPYVGYRKFGMHILMPIKN